MQVLLYALLALIIGVLSGFPPYHPVSVDAGIIRLSLKHQTKLLAECRRRTAEELAQLPPNMRQAIDCPRARAPLRVELDLDGRPLLRHEAQASGFSHDGAATIYQRFVVPAGQHRLGVRVNDDAKLAGFDFSRDENLVIAAGHVLVIDLDATGITLR